MTGFDVITVLNRLLLSPSIWLSAGVLCLGASILLGYHQDQMEAEAALAQKVQMPERVIVQNFSSAVNENEFNEIHLLAEAAMDRAIRVDVGSDGGTQLLSIIPLYPVSRESFPIARSLSETRRRPAPRSEAGAIAKRNAILERVELTPIGIMVFPPNQELKLPELGKWKIGQGANGSLFDLTGTHLIDAAMLELARDALAQNGVDLMEDALIISPFLEGRVSEAVADYSVEQNVLFWTSAIMIAFALVAMFSAFPTMKNVKKRRAKRKADVVESFPALSPFQPIADQEELGDDDDAQDAPVRTPSRIMTIATNALRTKSRP